MYYPGKIWLEWICIIGIGNVCANHNYRSRGIILYCNHVVSCPDENNNITSWKHACLYNVDPLKPHFYIVKLGFTGYTLFFLYLLKNIDCEYSLEPPRRGGSNEYPQSMFWAETWKISDFLSETFHFFCDKIFSIFDLACFRNVKAYI